MLRSRSSACSQRPFCEEQGRAKDPITSAIDEERAAGGGDGAAGAGVGRSEQGLVK
jgi:hypothetical protein